MTGHNYIDGNWVPAQTEETFERMNPSRTSDFLWDFPRSDAKDVDGAVLTARSAFGWWRKLSRIRRAEFLDAFAQLAKAETEGIAHDIALESGKTIDEARADVVEGIHTAQYWFGRARMPSGEVYGSEIAEKDSFMLRKPKGVVAAITPWNFPFGVPLWLICPAIAEGNTVVLKPAEQTPMTAHRLVELFDRAGLPPGVLNVVHGYGDEAGWPLVTHPEVNVVLFTGSYEVGSKIKGHCAGEPDKMAACEMGGKNALIVFDDADLDLAVNAAVLGAFRTSGQRCVSTSRILVQRRVLNEFERRFVDRAQRLTIGDPLDDSVAMGPLVGEDGVKKVLYYNRLAKKEGARVLLGGGRINGALRNGNFMSPFIYEMEHSPTSRVLREEVFGPHVAVIPFDTVEDAIRIYNDTDYGLSLAVVSESSRTVKRVQQECDFGLGYVNLPNIGAEVHLPFGGVKKSGNGLPSASTLIDVVTHRVAWTVNHAKEIKMAQGMSAQA